MRRHQGSLYLIAVNEGDGSGRVTFDLPAKPRRIRELTEDRTIEPNLLPYLRGEKKGPPHETLFWGDTRGYYFAVRRGAWKLVRASDEHGGDPELGLYDLANDVSESRNLLDEQPTFTSELQNAYSNWSKRIEEDRKK